MRQQRIASLSGTLALSMCLVLAPLGGCAVTEPSAKDRTRVASAIEDNPAASISTLSTSLGVSELAVVRALPEPMARRWGGEPASAWEAVRQWRSARLESRADFGVVISNGDPSMVYVVSPEDYQSMSAHRPVEILLDWSDIDAVWLLRKPTPGGMMHAVWFFDGNGVAVLRVSVPVNQSGGADAAGLADFSAMWGR